MGKDSIKMIETIITFDITSKLFEPLITKASLISS